jgi:plasmid stability protein
VRELTDAVMAARRIRAATSKQRTALEAGLRSCLERNVGKTIQRAGEGVTKRWKVV